MKHKISKIFSPFGELSNNSSLKNEKGVWESQIVMNTRLKRGLTRQQNEMTGKLIDFREKVKNTYRYKKHIKSNKKQNK